MIGVLDMLVKRCRVELRKHKHPLDIAVDAVADGYIHQSVFTGNRHRRL
jgi:hypothetical protein